MGCLNHIFDPEELEDLDHKQLTILDDAIQQEIRSSPDIKNMLRQKMQEKLLKRWKDQAQKKAAPRKKGAPGGSTP